MKIKVDINRKKWLDNFSFKQKKQRRLPMALSFPFVMTIKCTFSS